MTCICACILAFQAQLWWKSSEFRVWKNCTGLWPGPPPVDTGKNWAYVKARGYLQGPYLVKQDLTKKNQLRRNCKRRNKIYSKKLDATWCNYATHTAVDSHVTLININYVSSCYIIMMSLSDSQPSLPNAQVQRASVPKPGNNSALRANAKSGFVCLRLSEAQAHLTIAMRWLHGVLMNWSALSALELIESANRKCPRMPQLWM